MGNGSTSDLSTWHAIARVRLPRIPLAVAAAGFCTFLNLYTPQAILPALAAAFGVSPPQTGLSITAGLLAVAITAPFAGTVSDRLGRKRLIVAACLLVTVPTLLVAASQSLAALLAWRFVQGLLLPFIFTVTVAYIGDELEGAEAIRAAGLYASGAILGGVTGRLVAGLAADWAGWRAGFVAVAGVTALGGAFVSVMLPRERRFRPGEAGLAATLRDWRAHVANPLLLGTCAVGFGMLFSIVATFTYVNFYLAGQPFALSPGALALVFCVYLVGVVTTPPATAAAVRFGRAPTAALAAGVVVAGELLTLIPALPMVVLGLVLASGGLFVAQALALGFVGVAVSRARSTAVGLYVSVYYVGGALGGIVPAGLWHRFGWPGCVGLICGVAAAMGVAAALTFGRRDGRRNPSPTSTRG